MLFLPDLLLKLKDYYNKGNEVIIIDDGSNDGSHEILLKCSFIKLIYFDTNQGKGIALKEGIRRANNNAIILFDGDLEIDPIEIEKLMVLDARNNINSVLGIRFLKTNKNSNIWDLGNFFITKIFNYVYNTKIQDALCCAKAFYINSLNVEKLVSTKFDIAYLIFFQNFPFNKQNLIQTQSAATLLRL